MAPPESIGLIIQFAQLMTAILGMWTIGLLFIQRNLRGRQQKSKNINV